MAFNAAPDGVTAGQLEGDFANEVAGGYEAATSTTGEFKIVKAARGGSLNPVPNADYVSTQNTQFDNTSSQLAANPTTNQAAIDATVLEMRVRHQWQKLQVSSINLKGGDYNLDSSGASFSTGLLQEAGTWRFGNSNKSTDANTVLIGTAAQTFTDESGNQVAGPIQHNVGGQIIEISHVAGTDFNVYRTSVGLDIYDLPSGVPSTYTAGTYFISASQLLGKINKITVDDADGPVIIAVDDTAVGKRVQINGWKYAGNGIDFRLRPDAASAAGLTHTKKVYDASGLADTLPTEPGSARWAAGGAASWLITATGAFWDSSGSAGSGGGLSLAQVNAAVDARINTTPVAIGGAVNVPQDTPFIIALQGFDADDNITGYGAGTPQNGIVTGTVPNIVYTPNAGYIGSDFIPFTVSDADGNTSPTGQVDINVYAATSVTLEQVTAARFPTLDVNGAVFNSDPFNNAFASVPAANYEIGTQLTVYKMAPFGGSGPTTLDYHRGFAADGTTPDWIR